MLVRRQIGAAELTDGGLRDQDVLRMTERIMLEENDAFTRRFPAERVARVAIEQIDGTTVVSDPTAARGDPEGALSDDELVRKFRQLAVSLNDERRRRIELAVAELDRRDGALEALLESVLSVATEPASFSKERQAREPVIRS
jgi:2-methylcitrate dehydratase PrpD